ncbi:hypothetical protein B0O80DRAFT_442682 [Mortierella sp. GBAus27b]|nr:hypothetical protein B0O80DRAFT_442682 [Mortierella sp. GBAus27b]
MIHLCLSSSESALVWECRGRVSLPSSCVHWSGSRGHGPLLKTNILLPSGRSPPIESRSSS